jgi:hypothetical protein
MATAFLADERYLCYNEIISFRLRKGTIRLAAGQPKIGHSFSSLPKYFLK